MKKIKEDEKIKTDIPDSPFEDEEDKEDDDIKEMLNMNYKTIMGYSKMYPKKKIKEMKKITIVDSLKKEFGELNENGNDLGEI